MIKLVKSILIAATVLKVVATQAQQPAPEVMDSQNQEKLFSADWLVSTPAQKAQIYKSANSKDIILYNGLVKRTFRLSPNVVCIDYKNMITGQQLLRAVMPEAILTINGKEYNVGGLLGQKEKAYLLPEWLDHFTKGDNDFQFVSYEIQSL